MTKRTVSKLCVNKICGVCGDNAIGRNFGAITCESCKAFFRRAALKTKILNCSFENKCILDVKNRKSCKKCRLVKCYAIGMRKELIIKREESELIDNKETKNTRKRSHTIESNDSSTSFASLYESVDSICNPSPDTTLTFPDQSSPPPTDHSFFREDLLNEFLIETSCLNDEDLGIEIKEIESLMDSENSVEPEETTTSIVPVIRPIATFDKDFNDIELNRLSELSIASNDFHLLGANESTKYYIESKTIKEMFSLMSSHKVWDKIIDQMAKFCKGITTFKEVCEDDQLVLFKNSCWDVVSIKLLPFYNQKEEYWEYSLNNEYSLRCHLRILKLISEQTYYRCKNLFDNLPDEWRVDQTLTNLLMAISLFNCDTSKLRLTHKPLVKLNQQMYLYLLQRYLFQKFRSEHESSENLSRSLKTLMELHIVGDEQKIHTKEYAEYLTPLARELFDL